MHETVLAAELRRRADHLRGLALAIDQLSVLRLGSHGGEDTWRGRRPALCRSVLSSNQWQLRVATDELRRTALDFEQHADRLDAAALAERMTSG